MKRFDLTFKGEVLPNYDPGQVKTGFAELFHIKDPQILEELFSGDRIVLRANLDRKSAAEYFHKVSQLGGKAELVTATDPEGEQSSDQELDLPARRADPVLAVSKPARANPAAATKRRKHEANFADEPSPREVLSRLRKLQEEARTEHEAELELIDRQRAAAEESTARALSQLQGEHNLVLEQAGTEIQRLDQLEESAESQFDEHREIVFEEKEDRTRKLERHLSRFEEDIARHQRKAEAAEQALDARRETTRQQAGEAIAKLVSQIAETRAQMERDIQELDRISSENQERQISELKTMEQESEALAKTTEQDLLSLDLRLEEYQHQKEAELEEIRYLRSQAEHGRDADLASIADRQKELYQREKLHLEELKRARERQAARLEQKLERLRLEEQRLARGEHLPH